MIKIFQSIALVVLISFVGCGATVPDTAVEVEVQEVPVKAVLEDVANTGELGSVGMEIEESLQKMKADGHPKADELLADYEELKSASGAKLKSQAKAMADKL